jgi:hypothetical protein
MDFISFLFAASIFLFFVYIFYLSFRVKDQYYFPDKKSIVEIGKFQSSITYNYTDNDAQFNDVLIVFLLHDFILIKFKNADAIKFALTISEDKIDKSMRKSFTIGHINTIEFVDNKLEIKADIPYLRYFRGVVGYGLGLEIFEPNDELIKIMQIKRKELYTIK